MAIANNQGLKVIGLKDVILSIKDWWRFLLSKWRILAIMAIAGAGIGITYKLLSPPEYMANATFIVEESGQSNPLSALASIPFANMNLQDQEGLFSGDNLIWLYSSDRMIAETLMKPLQHRKEKFLLINWMIEFDKSTQKTITKIKQKDKNYNGIPNNTLIDALTVQQRRVVKAAVKSIKKNYLTVQRINPDVSVITVSFTSSDQIFAQQFMQNLVQMVNDFYILTKTKKNAEQVAVLQAKVDEFNKGMNRSMREAASAADAVPNPNPDLQRLRVAPQSKVVDVQINSEIYVTMVQQLEAAKVSLAKAEPLIQIIDRPELPLNKMNKSIVFCVGLGAMIFFIIGTLFVVAKRLYHRALN